VRTILVFRDALLPLSETFVANQSLYLSRYRTYFLGGHRASPSLPIPEDRLFVLNAERDRSLLSSGFWREMLFKLFGIVPEELRAWAGRIKPILLHAHFAPDGALALPLAKKWRIPLVVSFHGTDITLGEWGGFWQKWSWRTYKLYILRKFRLLKASQAFLVPSTFLLRKAIQKGYPREKLHRVPYGVETKFFYPTPERVEPGRILFVGRLIERKGLPYLLKALAPLTSEFANLRLVVIGDGPKREEYRQLAKRLLPGRTEFLGAQPNARVREEMQRAYLFSMPSITMPSGEAETFGLVYLEAQASGTPVVAFASGGVPEVVVDGETGYLLPEGSVDGLTRSIKFLLEREDLRHKMGMAARAWVEKRYDLRKTNAILENVYDSILRSRCLDVKD